MLAILTCTPEGRPCGASQAGVRRIPTVPKPERHVLVCLNTRPPGNPKGSCAEKGAEALFDRLKAMVKERGLGERVIVNRTSCLKHCSRGITRGRLPGERLVRRGHGGRPRGDLRVSPRGGPAARAAADARHPLGVSAGADPSGGREGRLRSGDAGRLRSGWTRVSSFTNERKPICPSRRNWLTSRANSVTTSGRFEPPCGRPCACGRGRRR